MQRGVHLPASGQPWKDRTEAAVTFPRPVQLPADWGVAPECGARPRDLCRMVRGARCHTKATAEETPLARGSTRGGLSARAGSCGMVVTPAGCHVLSRSSLIHSNCAFKAAWGPPEPQGRRGLLKAPRERLQLETPCPRDAASPRAPFGAPAPLQPQGSSCSPGFSGSPLCFWRISLHTPDSARCVGRAEAEPRDRLLPVQEKCPLWMA